MDFIDLVTCAKCKVVSDSEHALFLCLFAKYFVDVLAKFLDFFYNDNVPRTHNFSSPLRGVISTFPNFL